MFFYSILNLTSPNGTLICNFIFQVSLYFPVPLLCGTLIMLSQVMKNMPDIENNLEFPEETVVKEEDSSLHILSNLNKFEDDPDDEKYFDVKTDVSKNFETQNSRLFRLLIVRLYFQDDVDEERTTDDAPAPVPSSWFHRDIAAPSATVIPAETKHKEPTQYDPTHRNPAFAGGDKAVFVELALLTEHFHPTVALFAQKILRGELLVILYAYGDFVLKIFFLYSRRESKLLRRSAKRFHNSSLFGEILFQESETIANR